MKRIVFNQRNPKGRIIFGMTSLVLGLFSLLSAAYGKGESDGFKDGEDIGCEEAKRFYHEFWEPKKEDENE